MNWFRTCPFCGQGRLFVFRNLNTNKLYFHCEECERGYNDINKIDTQHSFLTILEGFDSVAATKEDIDREGWKSVEFLATDE